MELGLPEITLEPSSPPHVCPAVPRSEYCLVSRTHSFQACSQRESSEEGNAIILSAPVQSSLVSRTRWMTCQNQGICSELTELALALVLVYLMTLGNNRKRSWFEKTATLHLYMVSGYGSGFLLFLPFSPFAFSDRKGNRVLPRVQTGLHFPPLTQHASYRKPSPTSEVSVLRNAISREVSERFCMWALERRNTYQIPGMDLKSHLPSFPETRVCICTCPYRLKEILEGETWNWEQEWPIRAEQGSWGTR